MKKFSNHLSSNTKNLYINTKKVLMVIVGFVLVLLPFSTKQGSDSNVFSLNTQLTHADTPSAYINDTDGCSTCGCGCSGNCATGGGEGSCACDCGCDACGSTCGTSGGAE